MYDILFDESKEGPANLIVLEEFKVGYSGSMKTGTENRTGPGLVEPKTEPEPAFRTENRTGTDFFKFLGTGTRTGTEKNLKSSNELELFFS